ncbi:MAG: thiamine phosphate synthase [Spirulina sp.]
MGEPNWDASWQMQAVYRILDANLDRAREGLRIVEEWCRFGLSDRQLTLTCKEMRQEIATWHTSDIRQARDTLGDPGTDLSHPQEETRANLKQVLQANLCRVQEALRVLEEYGKLERPEMAAAAKQIRYRTYVLETELFGTSRQQLLEESRLYLVTSPSQHLFSAVEAALQGGLTLVQYRDKNADDTVRLAQAQKLCDLCHRYRAIFLVNDRIDIALAVDADGVHLGQQDTPVEVARQLLGERRIIGASTTNPGEMDKAIAAGADYIGAGPVYETPTKPGKAAAGFEYLRHVAANCPLPWFAIGGINEQNLTEVIDAGAKRVAVVRAIMQAEKPSQITRYFLSQLNSMNNYQ